jgi:methionine synthase II (cobalamin-independent)
VELSNVVSCAVGAIRSGQINEEQIRKGDPLRDELDKYADSLQQALSDPENDAELSVHLDNQRIVREYRNLFERPVAAD